jgi:isopentenyldiphosphate isomerase
VQQRSKEKESWPGMWDVSCAGHVSAGETSRQGALKELQEELGVCAESAALEFCFAWCNQKVLHDGAYINNEHTDVYILRLGDRQLSSFQLQAEEVEAVRYLPVDELRFAFSQVCLRGVWLDAIACAQVRGTEKTCVQLHTL